MNLRLLPALCCAFIMLFAACKKKDDQVTSTPAVTTTSTVPDRSKLNEVFGGFRSTPQNLTVTAGTNTVIYGAKGTKLTFYPNSFRDANGNTITSGTINIQLIEMYEPGEMIANRATTSAANLALISGGQVNIKATKAGQEVFAGKYGIGFQQPSSSSQRMSLYYGNTANADSVVTWNKADSAVGTFAPVTIATDTSSDTTGGGGGGGGGGGPWVNFYQFDSCIHFGWINCDYYWGTGVTLTNISAIVPDTSYHWGNTQIYVVIPSINSVMRTTSGGLTSTTFTGTNIPIGTSVKVVAVAKKGSDYYYAEQSGLTVTSYMSVPITFSVQTFAYIQARLAAF